MFDWLPNSQNTVNVTNTTLVPGTTNTAAVTLNNRWVTMATGKVGYAYESWGVLLYGKGGGAWVGTSSPGLTVNNVPASFTSTNSNNNFGATVGLGVEWAFADNWSAEPSGTPFYYRTRALRFPEAHSAPIQSLSAIAASTCSPPP